MALPQTVRVKLSSEAAEAISLTPVVVQELPVRELIEHMLGLTGKDTSRIRELLLRGTLVSGASRFRWAGWDAAPESIQEILMTFPDPEPSRTFSVERCIRAILRGGRQPIEIPREVAARKGLFRRDTFWDLVMEVVSSGVVEYAGYNYRERADRFTRTLSLAENERLRTNVDVVKYSTLREQIRATAFSQAELYVTR